MARSSTNSSDHGAESGPSIAKSDHRVTPHLPAEALPGTHAGIFLLAAFIAQMSGLTNHWPLYLLVPFLAYAVVVVAVPRLRMSIGWLRAGILDRQVTTLTVGLIAMSALALIGYQMCFQPGLSRILDHLPAVLFHYPVLGILAFSMANATLEEFIFRGILLEALASSLGMKPALIVQALAFGVLHMTGYPPGPVGVVLASVYGWLVGLLRVRTGGLAAPLIAHFCADATIITMVLWLP